ncbi:hypothetical protein RJT34_25256 [Clitoria ternatea]|uniref:Uncharacterized protein n=1 Tax=Clitoria ternatea TaxID=43366 RepID=A0AAN9IIQ7_CLITE
MVFLTGGGSVPSLSLRLPLRRSFTGGPVPNQRQRKLNSHFPPTVSHLHDVGFPLSLISMVRVSPESLTLSFLTPLSAQGNIRV